MGKKFQVGIAIFRAEDGLYCYGSTTKYSDTDIPENIAEGTVEVELKSINLLQGHYQLSIATWDNLFLNVYDLHERMYDFKVVNGIKDLGIVHIESNWNLKDVI